MVQAGQKPIKPKLVKTHTLPKGATTISLVAANSEKEAIATAEKASEGSGTTPTNKAVHVSGFVWIVVNCADDSVDET